MGSLLLEIRFAIRTLLRSPGYTFVAVAVLTLGVAANTTIFSVVEAVVLRPLPYDDPTRLVRISGTDATRAADAEATGFRELTISPNDFHDLKAENDVMESMAVFSMSFIALTGEGEPARLRCPVVSSEFFQVLGVRPAAGRFFLPEEEKVGSHRVVVLSHGLWQSRFGGSQDVVGRSITLGGNPFTVVGVAPKGMLHPDGLTLAPPDMWRPLALDRSDDTRGGRFLWSIGRLKSGVTIDMASMQMQAIASRLEQLHPSTNRGQGIKLVPLHDSLAAGVSFGLILLLGAVGFVLLIACASVATLTIARASTRQREFAVRAALGANHWRMLRQLLVESLMVSLAGGVLGFLMSIWTIDLIAAFGQGRLPRAREIGVDWTVLAFTVGAVTLTTIACGAAPALQAIRTDLVSGLKESAAGAGLAPSRQRLRSALVVVEVAISVVLLVGAGLMIQSFWKLVQVDPGFNPDQTLAFDLALPRGRYDGREKLIQFHEQLSGGIAGMPGVQAVGVTNMLPLSGSNSCDGFFIKGDPPVPDGAEPCAEVRVCSPGYFEAMGIELIAGRLLSEQDTSDAPPVVVISEEMARRHFPDGKPIGRFIGSSPDEDATWQEIVGVVGNVRHFGLDKAVQPEIYQAYAQLPIAGYSVVVRGTGDASALLAMVRSEVGRIDKEIPVAGIRTMGEAVDGSVALPRFRAMLLGAFAAFAALLAALGLYGVVAFSVTSRTREIGLRMALGASPLQVARMVAAHGLGLVVLGIGAGTAGALALSRAVASQLYAITPTDPLTYLFVAMMLLAVALAACLLPARRAASVDPLIALRCD